MIMTVKLMMKMPLMEDLMPVLLPLFLLFVGIVLEYMYVCRINVALYRVVVSILFFKFMVLFQYDFSLFLLYEFILFSSLGSSFCRFALRILF